MKKRFTTGRPNRPIITNKPNHHVGEKQKDYNNSVKYLLYAIFLGTTMIWIHAIKSISETKEKVYTGKGYDPSEILFLNTSDSSVLRDNQPTQKQSGEFSIDILTVGSISSVNRAKTQLKTWGSHVSRRHVWLATEFDDPDPTCHTTMTMDDLTEIASKCGPRSRKGWTQIGAVNSYTRMLGVNFGRKRWLLKKKNPTGWLCAQKRFVFALSKLMAMYREARNQHGVALPDYLVFGDDDTYVNLEMFEDQLLRAPQQEVKLKGLTLDDELSMVIPTKDTPVVWAGCRVRRTYNNTFPFGGFGVMISKAAIEQFIEPLYCNDTMAGFEAETCEHLTPTTKEDWWSVGESKFFKTGMIVSDLMGSYVKKLNYSVYTLGLRLLCEFF
jgi:hypothetical protein